MPFKWDAEANQKLFYCVVQQKQLTFGNEDHAAISKLMGEEVSAGAVRNRLSGLKTKLSREGVSATAAVTGNNGGVNVTQKRNKTAGSGTPKSGRCKKVKNSDAEDDNEKDTVGKIIKETKRPTKKRKISDSIAIHEDDSAKEENVKQEMRDDSVGLGDFVPGGETAAAIAEDFEDDGELYFG